MEKPNKMNILFKIAFIILLVCLVMFAAAIIAAYVFERKKWSAVFSAGGSALAFVGIILAMLSKPKESKQGDCPEENLDNSENL